MGQLYYYAPAMKKTILPTVFVVLLFGCDQPKKDTAVSGLESPKTGVSAASSTKPESAAPTEQRCMVETPAAAPKVEEQQHGECPTDPVFGGVEMAQGMVSFPDAPGKPVLKVELAKTDQERARGLMYRRSLPENSGMLFLPKGKPRVQSFWMRNTCISLDMMFIDEDGFIAGILENVPILNDEPRRIPCPTSYVLEVNGGWARTHGVKAGQSIQLP